jgi:uncharacterized protein
MDLCLVVDHACNLRCRYCYTGAKRSEPMPDAVIRKAVEFALGQNTGWLSITLYGGEPLLVPDILSRVESIAARVLEGASSRIEPRWLIDTNATLFTDRVLDWLRPPRQCRVFVSLDGPADVHDRHRADVDRAPTHARVAAALGRLRDSGIAFELVSVFGPDTAPDLARTLVHLIGHGPQRVVLQPNLGARWSEDDLARFREHAASAAAAWADGFRRGQPLVVEPLHSKVLSHLTGCASCPARCRLATQEVAVAPSGRIYPCAEMVREDRDESLVIGHVDSGLDADRVAQLRESVARVARDCEGCALRRRCSNYCACQQLALTGQVGRISPTLCELEAAWIDATDAAAGAVFREGCPAFQQLYYRTEWGFAPGSRPVAPNGTR